MATIQKFSPPDKQKHQPLDSIETERYYEQAIAVEDPVVQASARTPLVTGLRSDTHAHMRYDWLERLKHPKSREYMWAIRIPRHEICVSGDPAAAAGHTFDQQNIPCQNCRTRNYEGKSWITEEEHNAEPFHPKTINSIAIQWIPEAESDLGDLLDSILAVHDQYPVTQASIIRHVQQVADAAGIDRSVSPHALRHTFGCRLAAMGYDPWQICDLMRHADIGMSKWYCELRGVRKRDVVEENWDENAW